MSAPHASDEEEEEEETPERRRQDFIEELLCDVGLEGSEPGAAPLVLPADMRYDKL